MLKRNILFCNLRTIITSIKALLEHSPITRGILQWYGRFKRDLPWRKTRDPYKIWLSEIILQQTRVNQGLPYYHKFTTLFPDVEALAQASETEVMKAWECLGYYSRARNLHRCAKIISSEYHGNFPDSYEKLLELPGIGPYTAAAIASFCFDEPVPVVDGNVFRVLARVFGIDRDSRKSHKYFSDIAHQLIPHEDPGTFNQAIMEFGAIQCSPKSPECIVCPIQAHCVAFEKGLQQKLPYKSPSRPPKKRYFHYLVIQTRGTLYMRPRQEGDIWQGLYDFPLIEERNFLDEEDVVSRACSAFQSNFILEEVSPDYEHVLSHQKLYVRFYRLTPEQEINKEHPETQMLIAADPEERASIPKPVLITRYLNEHIF